MLLYNCGLLAVSSQQSVVSGQQENVTSPENLLTDSRQPIADSHYTNDLLVNPYFLPMLQQSVLYTSIASNNLVTWGGHIGDTYTAHYPRSAGGKVSIRLKNTVDRWDSNALTSDESDADNNTVVPIAEDGTLRFQGTERPGIYQVEVRTQDSIQRDFFAVNVDTTEADLTEIPLAQAAARIGAQTTADPEIDGTAIAADTYNIKRHGREIWGELLILVVCLMLLESFLSNRESAQTVGES